MTTSSAQTPAAEEAAGVSAPTGLSRRALFGLAGAAGLLVGAGGATAVAAATSNRGSGVAPATATHPFFGAHQAGIATEVQEHLHFAAFDMMARTNRDDLIELLQDWTYAAARMTQGLEVSASGAVNGSPQAPPEDTGEALGLGASSLTITIGFGPTLFEKNGEDRYGIGARRPAALTPLPKFLGEDLVAAFSDGDLCIQACADDPQVAVHAIRNLSRIAFGRASIRWSQLGFGRTSKTTADQSTPRNLFGFKDGTANILGTDDAALDEHVWVSDGSWLDGGSYLVARKIAMSIETWDRVRLAEQERVVGRTKGEGAPLSAPTAAETTEPDFAASGTAGPLIDGRSHVALAHPDANGGIRLLRRGYNYVDGNDTLGKLSAGLFFLGYQSSPERFVTVQKTLSSDALAEYFTHVGSGLWAIPPGASESSYVGSTLFA